MFYEEKSKTMIDSSCFSDIRIHCRDNSFPAATTDALVVRSFAWSFKVVRSRYFPVFFVARYCKCLERHLESLKHVFFTRWAKKTQQTQQDQRKLIFCFISRRYRAQLLDNSLVLLDTADSSGLFEFVAGPRCLHRRGRTSRKMRRLPLLLLKNYLPARKREEGNKKDTVGEHV